ncbi:uncharacterized protein V1513DRAFT_476651 [Lipomyces chichibuensis]|uniref:uncharacterized protein n=1 Tax=Lipomyces chichibuensis TaxID=1546026 RepID=UPI003342EAAF
MNSSTQQQPKQTYGRQAHRSRHWQGLTETELWARTSPVKKITSIIPIKFSPKSSNSTADAAVDNSASPFNRDSTSTELSRITLSASPTKYKKGLSEKTYFQEEKENGIQVQRMPALSKIKTTLSAKVESPRRPLLGKSVNRSTPVAGNSLPSDTDSKQMGLEPLFFELPEVTIDFSDLSACFDIISQTVPVDQVVPDLAPSSSCASVPPISLDEEFDNLAASTTLSGMPASPTPISSRSRADAVQNNPVSKIVSPIAIPKRESSLQHLNSILSSPLLAEEPAYSKSSPSPHMEVKELPRSSLTPASSPNNISPIPNGAPLQSTPLREVTNISDLKPVVEAPTSDLDDLLKCCTSREVQNFSKFIGSFKDSWSLQKLGEASYSEVYSAVHNESGASNVLKIMPFGKADAEIEQASVRDIVNELKISKTLMEYDGFVKLIDAHVVKGKYSDILLLLWDEFDEANGSENSRPDIYEDDQYYCIIILNNAGTDMEHFEIKSWREAAAIFWTVARSISNAEMFVDFEHRDLHWGNIVLHRPEDVKDMMANLSLGDEGSVNVRATIIDYTLSRAKCNGELVYTGLDDPAIYTGKGDYQFDIYRFARKLFNPLDDFASDEPAIADIERKPTGRRSKPLPPATRKYNWSQYCPKTNVLWLHYLAERLMNHKQLTVPRFGRQNGRNASAHESMSQLEIDAYRSLEAVFKLIDPRKKRYSSKKGPAKEILSAQDLINWSHDEGIEYH